MEPPGKNFKMGIYIFLFIIIFVPALWVVISFINESRRPSGPIMDAA